MGIPIAFAPCALLAGGCLLVMSQARAQPPPPPLRPAHPPVTSLALAPDGETMLAPGPRSLRAFAVSDAAPQSSLACDLRRVAVLAFAPDGQSLALGGGAPGAEGRVLIRGWPDSGRSRSMAAGTDLITALAWSPDGTHLAAGGAEPRIRLLPGRSTAPRDEAPRLLEGHTGPVQGLAFVAQGTQLLSVSADRSLRLWSVREGACLRTLTHHTDRILALAVRPAVTNPESPGGDTVRWSCATGGDDRTVRIWQPGIGRMVRIIRAPTSAVLALAYSSDGRRLFAGCQDGRLLELDPESDTVIATHSVSDDWILSVVMHPDGRRLVVGDASGTVKMVAP